MKKFFPVLIGAIAVVAIAVFADTILKPPTIEWDATTKYSDGRSIEAGAVVKYNVYRTTPQSTNLVKVATTTNLFYADTNAVAANTYTYRVAGELWGLEATISTGLVFAAYAPAQVTAIRLRPSP